MRDSRYKLKGLMLITTVVAVAAWILLAGGIFLTQSSQFQMLGANKMEEQARQFAEVDANLLQLVEYGKLTDAGTLSNFKLHTNRAQIQTVDAPDWEDEISIGNEQRASSGGLFRVATINIYRKGDTKPRCGLNVPIVKDAQMYSRSQLDKMIADATAQAKAAAEAAKKAAEEAAKKAAEEAAKKAAEEEKNYVTYVVPCCVTGHYDHVNLFLASFVYDVKNHNYNTIYFTQPSFSEQGVLDKTSIDYPDPWHRVFPSDDWRIYPNLNNFKTKYQAVSAITDDAIKNSAPSQYRNATYKMLFDRIVFIPTDSRHSFNSSYIYVAKGNGYLSAVNYGSANSHARGWQVHNAFFEGSYPFPISIFL